MIYILSVYLLGIIICYWMLTTEHKAEGNELTNGDNVMRFLLSILSWVVIIWMLIGSWIGKIKITGYWDKPVVPVKKEQKIKAK